MCRELPAIKRLPCVVVLSSNSPIYVVDNKVVRRVPVFISERTSTTETILYAWLQDHFSVFVWPHT